jgi:LysM repeat protein
MSVAAVSMLVALLGLGFGLVQMMNRAEQTTGLVTVAQADLPATNGAVTLNAAALAGPSAPIAEPQSALDTTAAVAPREIRASAKVLTPNYTIAAGDTLGQIAARFNTTVDRIQAFNNLSDPRALRIGTQLIIPPPL